MLKSWAIVPRPASDALLSCRMAGGAACWRCPDPVLCRLAGRDRIELKLAIGASRWEATQETLQRATRVALTPILNQMNVVGIVSIPGMMTGQILSGSDPSQARAVMYHM